MSRLRIRVELNRGGIGVPLHKLASVVKEAEKFFQLLAEDVHIERGRGEWLASEFDNGSLNFTAEYVGPVSPDQVRAFSAAFDGTTSLRRATIAQFTRIADAIGEDELIGFGLYHSDQETQPGEWRCLSRRDALRIAEEIQLLMGAAGELEQELPLPTVFDSSAGARLFKDRHDRAASVAGAPELPGFIREVEASLTRRIAHVEGIVEGHSRSIQDLHEKSVVTESSFRSLLTAVDNFCGQASRQLERLPAPSSAPEPPIPPPPSATRNWRPMVLAGILIAVITSGSFMLWQSKPAEPAEPKPSASATPPVAPPLAPTPQVDSRPASPAPSDSAPQVERSKPKPPPGEPKAPAKADESAPEPGLMRVELEASEPAWVSITDSAGKRLFERTLETNESHSIELTSFATLRTGNAGGLTVRLNGKPIGPLGPAGKVRAVEFKEGNFRIVPPSPAIE